MKSGKGDLKEAFRQFGIIGNIGFFIAFSILLGLAGGWWLDSFFSTSPFFTLLLIFAGVIAGVREIFKIGNSRK